MFDIDEQWLKKTVGNVIYSRGLDLYLRNKVRRLDFNFEEVENNNLLNIYSLVESAYGVNTYNVELSIGVNTGRIGYSCDCVYSQNSENICKHMVAVLLKWNREKDALMRKQNNNSSTYADEFIDYFRRNMISPTNRELTLNIRYELELGSEKSASLEMKVGETKTYVIKNMREFLSTVNNKDKVMEFGKNFTYDPEIYDFKEEDKPLIDMLLEIYEMDKLISPGDSYKYWGKPKTAFSGKKVILTDLQSKRFFKIMRDRSFDAVIGNLNLEDTTILEEDIPLEFDVKLTAKALVINQNDDIPVPITNGGEYFVYKNNIYHPSAEQSKTYLPFYLELTKSKSKSISFNKDDTAKIAPYILPSLKIISKKITVDDSLKKELYEEDLTINMYLDKAEEGISCDVLFKYGGIEINPLNNVIQEDNDKKVLIRDMAKELSLLSLLKNIGFMEENHTYKLKDEEKIVQFLTEDIGKFQEQGEVYYSESFKNMKVYTSSNIKSSVRLNDEDLLEFSFNIEGVDKKELKDMLEALRQKKKYYKLKKGGFVSLDSKELQDVGNMLDFLDIKDSDLEKDRILLSKYNALYIDQNLKGSTVTVEKNKRFRELVNNIKEVQDMDFSVPEHLEEIMRGYQKFGFKWLKTLAACGFGGILADEMGLGKTLQAIAFIESEVIENAENRKPSLVVAPTSLVYNWESEIEKFAPNLKTVVVSGTKDEREEKRKEIEEADVVITSYPLIRRDIEEYKEISFRYCILDEAQQIKNPTSINAQSVKDIKAKGYFALTGTPIENTLTELWSIFDFLMPGYLLSHGKFMKKYETPIVKNKDNVALVQLNKHVKPFILRRFKKDVVKELPPKIEHKLVVEMTEEQKKLYAAYIAEAKSEIDSEIKEKGFSKSKIKILATLTRLRQICCDPSVFIDNFQGESGKLEALDNILETTVNEGHRILLFSQFTTVLKNIAKRLDNSNIEYMYLDGQTKAEDRGIMVKNFNEGESSVFLISLKAGGTGLNLTGADVVIHFDPWWNPAVEDQATDRAHRIGQSKTVEVIKIIAKGTIEEKIYNLQEKKKDIIKSVMNDEGREENLISQMTQEELEELFKM